MNTQEFIAYLQSLDIKISLNNGKLRLNAPQGILTNALKQELTARKPEIIAYLENSSSTEEKNSKIEVINREGKLPLSSAQLRFWFIDQFQPLSPVYNIPSAFHLQGNLNINALEKTFNEIIQRHEVFRAHCETIDGAPKLKIIPHLTFKLPIIDLTNIDAVKQKSEVIKIINEEAIKPFSLNQAPLFRAKILKLNQQEWVLIMNLHHFIADGWSLRILYREISVFYEAIINQKSPELQNLPIQYIDYSHWQNKAIQGELYAQQLNYWQNQLQSSNFILDLPTDKPRPKIETHNGAKQVFTINSHLYSSLKTFSRQEKVTLFMTLLTGFKILLYRYSGQLDIIVGTTVSQRQKVEVENLIGTFANNLPLRTEINPDWTVKELLTQIKATLIQAYNNQDLPFEQLLEELNIARDLSRSPIYQVACILHQESNQEKILLSELDSRLIPQEKTTSQLDLSLSFIDNQSEIVGYFIYNQNLFYTDTIERMAGHFQTLLAGIINNPDEKISLLPLLTAAEKQQILIDWNNTKTDYPKDKCIHQLFEEQVAKTPDNIAVVFEEQKLTYQELNKKANQLAHYLQKLGVKPETLVGICVEKSLEMIIGILGILKAGGAYVPLDPNYPSDRLLYMLDNAQISVLLTAENLQAKLASYTGKIVCTDREWDKIEQESKDNLKTGVKSQNLAYVIYTSGSTGQPKGVMIEHISVVNIIYWRINQLESHDFNAFPFTTSISFDLSVIQIFPPLSVGGKIIIIQDLSHFATVSHQEKITYFSAPPSIIESYIIDHKLSEHIEAIGLGAEKVSYQLIEKLTQIPHINRIYNSYGPTETTIGSTSNLVFSRLEKENNSQ